MSERITMEDNLSIRFIGVNVRTEHGDRYVDVTFEFYVATGSDNDKPLGTLVMQTYLGQKEEAVEVLQKKVTEARERLSNRLRKMATDMLPS